MPRGKKEEESASTSEWLNTYADMVTLILTFFILLFSMSTISEQKLAQLASSFSGVPIMIIESFDPFQEIIEGVKPLEITPRPSTTPRPSPTPPTDTSVLTVNEQFDGLYLQLQQHIMENGLGEFVSVDKNGDIIVVRFADSALFLKGDAALRESAIPVVYAVAKLLERSIDSIENITIEGHTDNLPINSEKYPDNYNLSADRAINALRYIMQVTNIDGSKLIPVARSEYCPIDTNETEEGRARNRRVEFVIERLIEDKAVDENNAPPPGNE